MTTALFWAFSGAFLFVRDIYAAREFFCDKRDSESAFYFYVTLLMVTVLYICVWPIILMKETVTQDD